MKKLLICSILLALGIKIFGQAVSPEVPLASNVYLEKSKHQEATAWTLFGIGTGAIAGGTMIASITSGDLENDIGDALGGGMLIFTGIVLDLVSIPFFVGASNNKKHATKVSTSIKFEDLEPLVRSDFHQASVPAFSVKFKF
jgi:hypothetical protein